MKKLTLPLAAIQWDRYPNEMYIDGKIVSSDGSQGLLVRNASDGSVLLSNANEKIKTLYYVDDSNHIVGVDADRRLINIALENWEITRKFILPKLIVNVTSAEVGIVAKVRRSIYTTDSELAYIDFNKQSIAWSREILSGEYLHAYFYCRLQSQLFVIFESGSIELYDTVLFALLKKKNLAFPGQMKRTFFYNNELVGVSGKELIAISGDDLALSWSLPIEIFLYAALDNSGLLYLVGSKYVQCIGLNTKKIKFTLPIGMGLLGNNADVSFLQRPGNIGQITITQTHLLVAYVNGAFAVINKITANIEFFQCLDGVFRYDDSIEVSGNRAYFKTGEPLAPGHYCYYTFEGAGGYQLDS